MDRLELLTLGGLSLRTDAVPLRPFSQRKAEALLVYLASGQRRQSREVLAELLWDERSQAQSLSNLRTLLSELRSQLAPYLNITRQVVELIGDVWLDSAELDRQTSAVVRQTSALTPQSAAELEQALALYRGDFLEGIHLRDCRAFEEWTMQERERLRRQIVQALHRLVRNHLDTGMYTAGIVQVTRLLTFEPLDEEAQRSLIALLAYTGQRSAALAQYDTCCRLLKEELGIAPDPRTTALLEQIQNGTLLIPTVQPYAALTSTATFELDVMTAVKVRNPYKGLRAFQESDVEDFYGRESLIERLADKLRDELPHFLAVVGSSGSGKSSAVKAGLIPLLRRNGIGSYQRCVVVEVVPGANPLEELEIGLLRAATNPPPTLLPQLQENARGLLRAARRILPDEQTALLLLIDQLEELFTLVSNESLRQFYLDSLYQAATEQRGQIWIVATLRADFYDRPLQYERFGDLLGHHHEVVLPLTVSELERAILGPAARAGLEVEPGLTTQIITDVADEPGALPLLQFALWELYETREGRRLTHARYQQIGGIAGALAGRADAIYDKLAAFPQEQEATRQLFLRLVTIGEGVDDLRRRVPRIELVSLNLNSRAGAMEQAIDAFGQARLLTFDRAASTAGTGEPTVEVAHEALIRSWGRLREWMAEAHDDLRTHRRLAAATLDWQQHDRDASYLASGARLLSFDALSVAGRVALNADESAFLSASLTERSHQQEQERVRQQHELTLQRRSVNRLRYLALLLLLFLLVAGILAGVALSSRTEAINNADQLATNLKLSEARRLALESLQLQPSEDFINNLKALLAIRSISETYTPQGDQAVVEAAQLDFPLARLSIDDHFIYSGWALYSPDGNTVVTSFGTPTAGEEEMWLWDAHSFKRLHRLEGTFRGISGLMWTRDSRYLVAAIGNSREEIYHVWEVSTGHDQRQFTLSSDAFSDMVLTPDGKEILVLVVDESEHFAIRYVDLQTVSVVKRAELPFDLASTSIWLNQPAKADNTMLALISTQGQAPMIWDLRKGEKIRELEGTTERGIFASFSPFLKYIAMGLSAKDTLYSLDSEYIVQVWDAQTGEILWTFSGFKGVSGPISFSPDEHYLVTGTDQGDNKVQLWDLSTGKEAHRWPLIGENSIVFSPDGLSLMLTRTTFGVAEIYPIFPPILPHTLQHPDRVRGVAISHDGTLLATAGGDGVIRLWDARKLIKIREFVGHPERVTAVNFSPDDQYLLSAGRSDGYRLWDVQSGQQIWRFQGTGSFFYTAEISPDGKYMIAIDHGDAFAYATLKIVEVGIGTIVNQLPLPVGWSPNCARFSPDGSYVAASFVDAYDKGLLWEWNTNKPPLELLNTEHSPSRCGQFTPDGKYLYLGGDDGVGRLYDVADGTLVREFHGHADEFLDVAISQDSRYLLTVNADLTARIWEIETAREIRRFTYKQAIWGAAYSPDGKTIAIGSYDGNAAYILRTNLNEEIVALCARLTRDFTPQERITYDIPNNEPTCPQ